jgi:sulfane dehydrogenase subunit SoxC
MKRKHGRTWDMPDVAGNGLLDRRALLGRGVFFAGAAVAGIGSTNSAGAEALPVDPWSMEPGAPIPPRRAGKIREQSRPHAH